MSNGICFRLEPTRDRRVRVGRGRARVTRRTAAPVSLSRAASLQTRDVLLAGAVRHSSFSPGSTATAGNRMGNRSSSLVASNTPQDNRSSLRPLSLLQKQLRAADIGAMFSCFSYRSTFGGSPDAAGVSAARISTENCRACCRRVRGETAQDLCVVGPVGRARPVAEAF